MSSALIAPVGGKIPRPPFGKIYTGDFQDGTLMGKRGTGCEQHAGFVLEPGCFPDSPNHPEWPSPILRQGQIGVRP